MNSFLFWIIKTYLIGIVLAFICILIMGYKDKREVTLDELLLSMLSWVFVLIFLGLVIGTFIDNFYKNFGQKVVFNFKKDKNEIQE